MAAACTYTPIHAPGVETDNIKTACIWQVSPGYKQEHQYTGMQAQQIIDRQTNGLTDRQTAKQADSLIVSACTPFVQSFKRYEKKERE